HQLAGFTVVLAALHSVLLRNLWSPGQSWALPRWTSYVGLFRSPRADLPGPTRPCEGLLELAADSGGVACHDLGRGVDVLRVEVGKLGLRDLAHLIGGDGTGRAAAGVTGSLVQPGGLENHLRCRGRLGDEGEGTVLVDGDLYGDDVATLGLRSSVVLLTEVHDVDTVRTKSGTDGRRRGDRKSVV